jgi:feruloyl esterase
MAFNLIGGGLLSQDRTPLASGIRRTALFGLLGSTALLSACAGVGSSDVTRVTQLSCDLSSVQNGFKPDANTSVVAVRVVKAGETVVGADSPAHKVTMKNDVCLVKLLIGPGNTAEPTAAPSYSQGIGMEIWLPAKDVWNERIRNYGGGGWVGGGHRYADQIGSKIPGIVNANIGYAVGTHDGGQARFQDGSFFLKADGTINQSLMQDFWTRSVYEQAVKTRALVKAYYGKDPKFSYLDGHSQGGRQTLKAAQEFPGLYDGYLVAAPAINVSKMGVTSTYPQLVMKADLGFTALDTAQAAAFAGKYNAVNTLAVKSCDKAGLGFLLDPFACTYDPSRDPLALCAGVAGNGVTGANATGTCVNLTEANAINKIWYGATIDGSHDPNQSYDARSGKSLGAKQLWWAWGKGTNTAGSITAPVGTDWQALVNQDASYASSMAGSYASQATKAFTNASTPVRDRWLQLTYATLTGSFINGLTLQPFLGNPNTDNPDLAKARDLNRKILMVGGLADNSIPAAGWINYYHRVATAMGGDSATQKFFRLYMVPGLAHSSTGASTSLDNGFAGYPANKAVPLPLLPGPNNTAPTEAQDQMFTVLKDWVENGVVPGDITIYSGDQSVGYPICVYPKKTTWNGSGNPKVPASYTCQ